MFGSPMKIYENILKGKVKYPAYINPDAQDLLEKLITADLTKRLGNLYGGPGDVKNHPWFTEVTWDRLARKDIDAPYTPPVKAGAGDASQFDRYPEDPERYGTNGHDEWVSLSRTVRGSANVWFQIWPSIHRLLICLLDQVRPSNVNVYACSGLRIALEEYKALGRRWGSHESCLHCFGRLVGGLENG
ncbi:hypothetical protein CBS470a_002861 [Colletotrichum nupharicola]|nr:hypothetical protein CBS470a_002861 [Colletotrichum nupharicola]